MKVDVQHILALYDKLREFDQLDLAGAEFYDGDKLVEIDRTEIAAWDFTGLSNMHFITSREWSDGPARTGATSLYFEEVE